MSRNRGAVSGETNTQRRGRAFLAVPLILVNLTAVWGQAGWAFSHITSGGFTGALAALVFALAVESIGVYLAWESHESLMADQASALLRFGSYAVGLLVGLLNFLHFSGQSLAAGVAFGALSAVSPWLWGVWSRARNRARLAELGLVDIRGVKLSLARKVWHPIRSVRVLSWAAWAGVTDPAEAVAQWQESRQKPVSRSETPQDTTVPESEPEFEEPAPVVRRVTVPASVPADVQVDAETIQEIDEIEIHRVMRETKPRVSTESVQLKKAVAYVRRHPTKSAKDVRDATGVSRATAYRAVNAARQPDDETAVSA